MTVRAFLRKMSAETKRRNLPWRVLSDGYIRLRGRCPLEVIGRKRRGDYYEAGESLGLDAFQIDLLVGAADNSTVFVTANPEWNAETARVRRSMLRAARISAMRTR